MHPTISSCYVLHAKGDIRREDRAIGNLPPGHVLVGIRRMGICGSDVHYFLDGQIGAFYPTRPFILGHEAAGEIVEVAPDVDRLRAGMRVAIEPSQPCRTCRYCSSGRYNLCQHMKYLGSASTQPPTDGMFCEFAVIPASSCFAVPDALDDTLAALVEPLSVAIHAVRQAGSIYGSSVLITGGGAIGQLVLVVARAYGAGKIGLSDPVEQRRQVASIFQAHAVFNPNDPALVDRAFDFCAGGFDSIFEVSGSPHALRQAFDLVRPGGTIVQVGSLPSDVNLPANLVMRKELRLVGSFRFANVFQDAIDLIASGRVDLHPLVTHTFSFDRFQEAMDLACAREGAIKVQVTTAS